jgi:hypothetical protein
LGSVYSSYCSWNCSLREATNSASSKSTVTIWSLLLRSVDRQSNDRRWPLGIWNLGWAVASFSLGAIVELSKAVDCGWDTSERDYPTIAGEAECDILRSTLFLHAASREGGASYQRCSTYLEYALSSASCKKLCRLIQSFIIPAWLCLARIDAQQKYKFCARTPPWSPELAGVMEDWERVLGAELSQRPRSILELVLRKSLLRWISALSCAKNWALHRKIRIL